jgi:lysozyme family protein
MLAFSDPLFQRYANFTGIAEGGLSRDQEDSAKSCVGPGMYHTNRGVTFCTYKGMASTFGLAPTYQRFLMLTKEEANKFLHAYYRVAGKGIKNPVTQFIATNIAWGSGQSVVPIIFRATLRENMGLSNVRLTGGMTADLLNTINAQNPARLNDELMKRRLQWLKGARSAKKHLKGWIAREDRFRKEFMSDPAPSTPGTTGILGILAIAIGAFFFLKRS